MKKDGTFSCINLMGSCNGSFRCHNCNQIVSGVFFLLSDIQGKQIERKCKLCGSTYFIGKDKDGEIVTTAGKEEIKELEMKEGKRSLLSEGAKKAIDRQFMESYMKDYKTCFEKGREISLEEPVEKLFDDYSESHEMKNIEEAPTEIPQEERGTVSIRQVTLFAPPSPKGWWIIGRGIEGRYETRLASFQKPLWIHKFFMRILLGIDWDESEN